MPSKDPGAQAREAAVLPIVDPEAVAFDIETTGLSELDSITCVCVCGAEWHKTWAGPSVDVGEIVSALNKAPQLVAYNGATFDILFMQRAWGLSDTQVGLWMAKLVDPLYIVRGLFGTSMCEKLQTVLLRNGLEGKSGSGLQAIEYAQNGEFEKLSLYCLQDTKECLRLIRRSRVRWNGDLELAVYVRGQDHVEGALQLGISCS